MNLKKLHETTKGKGYKVKASKSEGVYMVTLVNIEDSSEITAKHKDLNEAFYSVLKRISN